MVIESYMQAIDNDDQIFHHLYQEALDNLCVEIPNRE